MTLRRKIALVEPTSWPLLALFVGAALGVGAARGLHPAFTITVAAAVFVVFTRYAPLLVLRGAYRRLARLVRAEDRAAARVLLGELRACQTQPSALAGLALTEAAILATEERHAEARALLEPLDRRLFAPPSLAHFLNALAWTFAQTGRAHEAVELARESLATGRVAGLRSYQLGTLGTALVLDGKPDLALAPLEDALSQGGTARAQAIRAFYLGEALRALGRRDDAKKAYTRATEAGPATTYAERAKRELEALHPYR
jgi:tetratricopeptide (TPR) repeat protein